MNDEQRYQKAKERVQEIKGFYIHFLIYLFVNAGLFLINFFSSPGHWWFYWPLIGWGIGILAHAMGVFGLAGFLGKEWEERKIKEIMEKEES
jgi:hypothetical protein